MLFNVLQLQETIQGWRASSTSREVSVTTSFISTLHKHLTFFHSFIHSVPFRSVPFRPVPSRPVPSRPVPSRPVPSHRIASHRIASHRIASRRVPSRPVPSHPIPSHPIHSFIHSFIHIYVPSCLIVVLSWISFWLHRDASPPVT